MSKLHQKEGFEYRCERILYEVQWHYRPIGEPVFLPFSNDMGKSLKIDLEAFLRTPEAMATYRRKLERDSNVPRAEQELKDTLRILEHRLDPEALPLRGNNPNRDARRARDAQNAVSYAESRLATAQRYRKILEERDQVLEVI